MSRATRRLHALVNDILDQCTCQQAIIEAYNNPEFNALAAERDAQGWSNKLHGELNFFGEPGDRNLLCIDGRIHGHCECLRDCLIGDGIDLQVGENCVIIGCTFTRAFRISLTEENNQELNARHRVIIGDNSVIIGCAFRDSVTVGRDSKILMSALTQVNIGNRARIVWSSVLMKFGHIGDDLTMMHSVLSTDPAVIGDRALFGDGLLSILDYGMVLETYTLTIRKYMRARLSLFWISGNITSIMYESIESCDRKIKEATERGEEWRKPQKRVQACHGEDQVQKLGIMSKVPFNNPLSYNWENKFYPLLFQVADNIRDKNAEGEEYFRAMNCTAEDFYTGQKKRISIGNDFTVLTSQAFRMGSIGNSCRNHPYATARAPGGMSKLSWEMNIRQDYDFQAGNNVTITAFGTWMENGFPDCNDNVGRLVLQDGATLYIDRPSIFRYNKIQDNNPLLRVRVTNNGSNHSWPVTCAITVSRKARLYVKGFASVLAGNDDSSFSTLTVEPGQTAVI